MVDFMMIEQEIFKNMLLNDSYILWLNEFMKKKKKTKVDNGYFICDPDTILSSDDIKKLGYLNLLYAELLNYLFKNYQRISYNQILCMKYKNKYIVLKKDDGCCYCSVHDAQLYIDKEYGRCYTSKSFDYLELLPYIEYEDLKTQYSLEDKSNANNIKTTSLDELINKIVESSRDFYIKICNVLTPEERLFIIKVLENKNCLNCTNTSCRVPYKEKIGLDENGNQQGSKCIDWRNEELIGKSKVLGLTDINELK